MGPSGNSDWEIGECINAKPYSLGMISNLGSTTVNMLWSLNCWARGAMMVYCNLMVTTMVDSNEMFVNEAIHQGTDMRHPMCPNAIFSREKKPRPKSSSARIFAEYLGLSCDV